MLLILHIIAIDKTRNDNMCKPKLTISEVAKLAGVSKTTISHFLNGKFEYMSKATKEHVGEVIKESGYQPSKIAQSLKSQNSFIIGIIVSDIESPFTAGLIKSVEEALEGTNYLIMTANTDNSIEKEIKAIEAMQAQQVDGLIIHTNEMENPYIVQLAKDAFPIVLADRFIKGHDFDIVHIDNDKPISDLIDHLFIEGYEDVYFFSEDESHISTRQLRASAFSKKLEVKTGEVNKIRHIDTLDIDMIKAEIVEIMEHFVRERKKPAIVCENGVVLFVVAKCMKELGLSLPEEIALCGYDDWGGFSKLGWADMLVDGITTVTPSVHDLGQRVTDLLLTRIANPESASEEIILDAPMIVRNSTELRSFYLKEAQKQKSLEITK